MSKETLKPSVGEKLATEIGQTNAHALESIVVAYQASLSLISQGCDVAGIISGWRKPVIQLASAPPENVVTGAFHQSRSSRSGIVTIYAANYMGAQIEWRKHTCH